MSGAFELAAGAFAVVGVVDVLVRTGRDLYNFLRDIDDAPVNATKLCETIAETVLLADASKRYLLELKAQIQPTPIADTPATLALALKALDRELKSLKTITTKCKSNKKRWSSIRYALNEQRVDKALSSLDRSKSTLTTALTLACRDLTCGTLQRIEDLIHQISSKTVDLCQLITKIDASERSMTARLKAFHQDEQNARATDQRALSAKLKSYHEAVRGSQDSHTKSLTAIRQAQSSTVSSQRQILAVATRNGNQTARMSRNVDAQFRAADRQVRQNTKLIIATISRQIPVRPSSGREIEFHGKRQDLVVSTLTSIEMDLASIFDEIYTQHGHDVHSKHVSWLQAEIQNLIASASQEVARLHTGSTTTSFDAWTYPAKGRDRGARKKPDRSVFMREGLDTAGSNLSRDKQNHSRRSLWFRTAMGTFQIRLPRRDVAQISDGSEEVGVFLRLEALGLTTLDARFVRLQDQFLAPKIYGQLNIFLPIDNTGIHRDYWRIMAVGSIKEIDQALRNGTICPYRDWELNGYSTGINPLFWLATGLERVDILHYLDSQGIGFSTLRQQNSICYGITVALAIGYLQDPPRSSLDSVLGCCADPLKVLAETIMMTLIVSPLNPLSANTFWSSIRVVLERLYTIDCDVALQGQKIDHGTLERHPEWLPDLVRILVQNGVDPNITMVYGTPLLHELLRSSLFQQLKSDPEGHVIRRRFLSVLIDSGADVLRVCPWGSATEFAWGFGHWDVWCEALQENGIDVPEANHSRPQGCWIRNEGESDDEETDSRDPNDDASES